MKTDIILCGVGGQGILSIATVIGEAAMNENLYIKQAEVHGMSQRGGDVQSNLRISSSPIASDLIPKGGADVIISDNLTTAMTGGQDSAGTNKFEAICRGLGVSEDHLHVVVPLPKNMPEITRIIREEINYHGVSVIIPRRECIQTFKRKVKK